MADIQAMFAVLSKSRTAVRAAEQIPRFVTAQMDIPAGRMRRHHIVEQAFDYRMSLFPARADFIDIVKMLVSGRVKTVWLRQLGGIHAFPAADSTVAA